MPEVAYLSSTGEVKIPLRVRIKLGLRDGEKFQVETRGQHVFMRRVGLAGAEQVREFLALRKAEKATSRPVRARPKKSFRKKIVGARNKTVRRSTTRARRAKVGAA